MSLNFLQKHVIKAMRVFPRQRQILVIRQVDARHTENQCPIYAFEMYAIPQLGTKGVHQALDRIWINDVVVSQIHISLLNTAPPPRDAVDEDEMDVDDPMDLSIQPELPAWQEREPDPVSIYLRTSKPDGMQHLTMWPRRIERPPTPGASPSSSTMDLSSPTPSSSQRSSSALSTFSDAPTHFYPLQSCNYQAMYDFSAPDAQHFGAARIVPGTVRALVWGAPRDSRKDAPPLIDMWSYASPERRDPDADATLPEDARARIEARQAARAPCRSNCLAALSLPPPVRAMLTKGVQAMAFDDTIGRVFASADKCQKIFIIDFAAAPRENDRGERLPLPVTYAHRTVDLI
jgi:hypothetical protein